MILRQAPRGGFSTLPNSLLRHPRLSIDTKGMLAFINSLPPDWDIRQEWLARALSCETETGVKVGRDRIRRMFQESIAEGFIARSKARVHSEGGYFGAYVYIVGTDPADVRKAIEEQRHIEFLPMAAQPTLAQPTLAEPLQYKGHKETNERPNKGGGEHENVHSLIGDDATVLSRELLVVVGLDYEFLPPSWCGFALHLQGWLNAGASADVIRVAFRKVMGNRNSAPDSPLYFAKAIAREQALLAQPLPTISGGLHGKPGRRNTVDEVADRLLAEYRSKESAESQR